MTTQMSAALAHLNAVTERSYTIVERDNAYALVIPTGGEYPPVAQADMLRRIVTLTIAAQGREVIKPLPK